MNFIPLASIQHEHTHGYTVLLDGYNLIMRHPRLQKLELPVARQSLLETVKNVRWPFPVIQLVLVFDGPENSICLSGDVVMRFSHPSADSFILHSIRSAKHPGRLAVISDDRELVDTAKSHGVFRYSSEWLFQCSSVPLKNLNHPRASYIKQKRAGRKIKIHRQGQAAEMPDKSLRASTARKITEELENRWLGSSTRRKSSSGSV